MKKKENENEPYIPDIRTSNINKNLLKLNIENKKN